MSTSSNPQHKEEGNVGSEHEQQNSWRSVSNFNFNRLEPGRDANNAREGETPQRRRSVDDSILNWTGQLANTLPVVRRNFPVTPTVPLSPLSGLQFSSQNSTRRQYFQYHQRNSGSRNGFYTVGGYSDSRGQLVYFNCLTSSPLALQLTNRGINMEVPNGFGGGFSSGGGNFAGGNPNQQRQQHSQPGQSASQTVNHGANVFNFYFVNSGHYDLNFTGNGLPGVGGQAAGQAPARQPQGYAEPASYPNNGIGNQFPEAPVQARTSDSSSMFANFGNGRNVTASPSMANGQVPQQLLAPYCPMARPPVQHFGHGSAFVPAGNYQVAPPFSHYREGGNLHNAYRTMSQGSLDNFDDLYDNEEGRCSSQCSAKSAPYGGPPCRCNGQGCYNCGRFNGPNGPNGFHQ